MQNIKIIKSRRKTISLHIKPNGNIELKAPIQISDEQIQEFIKQKSNWIETHIKKIQERQKQIQQLNPLTSEDIRILAEKALEIIPKRVEYFAKIIGVTYGRITIRNQKSRWGSCSSNGNLSFNCLLMLAPPEVLDAIIVHELCHRKHMNHSKNFYAEVYHAYPEYDKWNNWLKENGVILIQRMIGEV